MNNVTKFPKTSLSGGFFVLMPLVMFYLLVDEMIELLVALATPIADLFPHGLFENIELPGACALA